MNETQNTKKVTNSDALLFNLGNYQATEMVFRPSLEDVKKDVRNICGKYLSDIRDVIVQVDRVNGAINCYITIPSNSPSLRDSADIGVSKDSSIRINLPSYSKDLIKLTEMYSPNESKNMVFRDTSTRKGDTAVKIDLLKIFATVFDTNGSAYYKQVNDKVPKMELVATPGYANKEGRFDKVTHFTIEKRLFVPHYQQGKFKPSAPFRIK